MDGSRSPILHALVEVGRGLLDVVYPPRCLGCGHRAESPQLPLCTGCLQSMERAPAMAVAARLDRLSVGRGALDRARALWVFDKGGTLQDLQHALKYGDRPRYGVSVGRLMGDAYASECPRPDGVVPIPLHHTRRLERGYNQAAMLARGVADAMNLPLRTDLLARPHPTRSQTHLSRAERWQNVCDAFAARPDAADAHWLLVDDVLTTGSTAVAAALTLKEAGATGASLVTLAMART
jgi:predicted amidophosphoribosyltransferase